MKSYILREVEEKDKKPDHLTMAAEYDGGFVSSPRFGDVHIKGCVFFVLPHGVLPEIDRASVPAAQKYLAEYARELVDENSSYFKKFLTHAENAIFIAPSLKWPGIEIKTFLKFNSIFWYIDDYLDNMCDVRSPSDNLSHTDIHNLAIIVGNMYRGVYEDLEEILDPKYPSFHHILKCLFKVYIDLSVVVEDYHKRCLPLAISMENWLRHHGVHVDENGIMWENEHTHMHIRKENGFLPVVEMIALLDGITVPDYIRNNFVFQSCFNMVNNLSCWTNDTIGVRKEIECEEIAGNLVLRKVVRDGLSLRDAIDYVDCMEREHVVDYIKLRDTLKIWYKDNKHVQRFILLWDYFTDATIILYGEGKRYGSGKWELKKVALTD